MTAGLVEDATILSEYVQESVFALDTVLAFSVILRRYLPESDRPKAALFGVVTTIVIRAIFALAVNGVLDVINWLVYLVGVFLIYKGWKLLRSDDNNEDGRLGHEEDEERRRLWVERQIRRCERITVKYGVAHLPPMVLAVVFLTFADPIAWPDGGSTYPVIMASALALLPIPVLVRHAERIIKAIRYLPYGLGVLAGFFGLNVVLLSLADNTAPFVNAGQPIESVPTIGPAMVISVTVTEIIVVIACSSLSYRYSKARRREADVSAVVTAGSEGQPNGRENCPLCPAPAHGRVEDGQRQPDVLPHFVRWRGSLRSPVHESLSGMCATQAGEAGTRGGDRENSLPSPAGSLIDSDMEC
jgi:tellurite resistance protein TerC